ncbi:MAG: hypothetical protein LBB98_11165 [Treponema sp.]|jgi:hypothetical protein|nr:hypothetical protein [Treponema sp.]
MTYEENRNDGALFRSGEEPSSGADLLRSLPRIRRARGFRLYTEDGRRLTDLWQYGGQAVLGHTPSRILVELKNAASRGLFAPFPGCYEGRLVKALSRLFPGRVVRLYAGDSSLRRALAQAGYDGAAPFSDPAFPPSMSVSVPPLSEKPSPLLWRPFLEAGPGSDSGPDAAAQILVPVLPLPWTCAPRILVLDKTLEAAFPASGQDLLSPVVLAAAARSVWDLIAALPEGAGRKFPRIRKALSKSPWRRRGIYLTLGHQPAGLMSEAAGSADYAYASLFSRFLETGFLLPPSPRSPLILPGEMSPGEEAALAACLQFDLQSDLQSPA